MRRLCAVVLLVVAAAVPAAIAGSTDSTPLTGAVSQTDKTWFCLGPVNLSSVTVVIKSVQSDAVHLAAGCTGTIGKLTVVQYQRDGVKVAPGAHDLTVGGGSIRCYAPDPGQHQDGIQAMGGQRVTFVGMDDQCLSANNSAFFVSEGPNNRELPTDIVWVHVALATVSWIVLLWAVAAAGQLVPRTAAVPAAEREPERSGEASFAAH